MKLLNVDNNAKTVKGQARGFLTGVLYLAPAKMSGFEVCPKRSLGCTVACLNTAGRGAFDNVQAARIAKTKLYFEDRPAFMAQLVKEIAALVRKADREGLTPAIRLNGTSDIPWERVQLSLGDGTYPNVMTAFPDVQFYDYTKIAKRALAHAAGDMPSNYHLTFSLTEDNDREAVSVLQASGSVAAVFKDAPKSVTFYGRRLVPLGMERDYYDTVTLPLFDVVDGDASDLRFLDPAGVVVALKAKGKARKDTSGFVR